MKLEFVNRPQAMENDAGADEQCRFGGAVAEQIERSPAQGQRGEQAEADSHQSHVADGGKGEQPLEMTLAETHDRAQQRGDDANAQKESAQLANMRSERRLENRPINPGDGIESELNHDAGKKNANRRGSNGVSIGQPEVKGNQSGFRGETTENEHEGDDYQAVGSVPQRAADLRHVERAGAPVEKSDSTENQESANRICDGEIQ